MVTDYDCWHPDHDECRCSYGCNKSSYAGNAANAQNMIREVLLKSFEKHFLLIKTLANDCLNVAIITDPKNYRTKKTIR